MLFFALVQIVISNPAAGSYSLDVIGKDDSSYPNLLDTKAEVLWRIGFFDEAINTINEAISIDQSSQYYKDQKLKFETSKKNINAENI